MEKIVICWSSGDGYTCSCENTVPLSYESIEAAMVDFEKACWDSLSTTEARMFFAGHEFDASDFFYCDSRISNKEVYDGPAFYTLEEWWNAFQPD